jgi:hypothetical protein
MVNNFNYMVNNFNYMVTYLVPILTLSNQFYEPVLTEHHGLKFVRVPLWSKVHEL